MRDQRSLLGAILALSCIAMLAGAGMVSAAPNFIVMQADDFPWLPRWTEAPVNATFFSRDVATPYIDRIRDEGVVFTNGYVTSPQCAPSRFATLTSKFNSRGIHQRMLSQLEPEAVGYNLVDCSVANAKIREVDLEENVAAAMKAAGYSTGVTGKWHLDAFALLGKNFVMNYTATQISVKETGFDFCDGLYPHNIGGEDPYSHNLEWITEQAKVFISQAHEEDKPFFLYYNPTTPHDPDNYKALFHWNMTTTPAGELETEPVSGMPSRESVWERAKEFLTEEEIAAELAAFPTPDTGYVLTPGSMAAGIVWTDDAIGALYEHLVDLDILDNTVIILLNDHGMDEKGNLGEGGLRTMFTVRYPPVFSAGMDDRMISNMDIVPTVVDLAGLDAPYNMDGRSFATTDPSAHQLIFSEILFDRALSTPSYKYRESTAEGNTTKSFFNLQDDPGEMVNLIDDPSYADVAQEMALQLACFNNLTALSSPDAPMVSLETCGVVGTVAGTTSSVDGTADGNGADGDDSSAPSAGLIGAGLAALLSFVAAMAI